MRYPLTSSLTPKQIDQLHALYQNEWWTATRTKKEIKTMLRHSDIVIGILSKKGKLIGFARVLSDRVFKAEIYDVIVHPAYRDKGLGKVLIEAILQHKKLRNVRQFNLQCLPEMVPYYARWGFEVPEGLVYLRFQPSE